jgi:hemoglobin-like flavoprotein
MTDPFTRSLDLLAARGIDPAPAVYARVFAAYPGLEALFVRDRSGTVRGQMLQVALEALLDLNEGGFYAPGLLHAERVNHQGLGVPAAAFDAFLAILMETVRDLLGPDWDEEMGAAWRALLARADALLAEAD